LFNKQSEKEKKNFLSYTKSFKNRLPALKGDGKLAKKGNRQEVKVIKKFWMFKKYRIISIKK